MGRVDLEVENLVHPRYGAHPLELEGPGTGAHRLADHKLLGSHPCAARLREERVPAGELERLLEPPKLEREHRRTQAPDRADDEAARAL
ncbi:MAG: hypothetical protein AB1486_34250, partial [Planctomycetota bacterium]